MIVCATLGATPCPDSATVEVALLPVLLNVRMPCRVATFWGWKFTGTVQLLPGASEPDDDEVSGQTPEPLVSSMKLAELMAVR